MSSAAAVANPQVQTQPAPALPPDTPILAAPPRDPEMVQPQQPPVPPLIPPAPPAIDEPALRERELAVERREDELNRRMAQRRELHTANLTEKDVEAQIVGEFAVRAFDAFAGQPNMTPDVERALQCVTVCALITRSGFPIIGTSVCSAPENYDAQEGRKEAKADAMAKLWLCEEYALRNRLMGLPVIDEPGRI